MAEKLQKTLDHVETGASDAAEVEPQEGKDNVPAGHVPVTSEERALSRALNRKLDFALLPFLSLLYLFNGLDRGNVGNAETQGKAPGHSLLSFEQLMSERLHNGHRCPLGRSQSCSQLILHHVCALSASVGCSGEMGWSEVLGTVHHVLLGCTHHMSSVSRRTRCVTKGIAA